MKKKITSVILFILITLIATTIYAAVTANANLVVSSSKVKPGEEFTVKLNLKDINAGSDGLMGVQLKIDYDKNILETLSETSAKGLSGLTAYYNESAKGNILIVSGMSGIKTDSDFVEVTFKVKVDAELKDTTITFQDIEIFNLEKANIGNKSVTVKVANDSGDNENGGNEGNDSTPTPSTKPTATPDGGSESTPTPSTKPNTTGAPTATAKPNSGENKNDVPVTNIDTNTSSGSGSTGSSSSTSNKGTTGSTTSSNSLPKAGIGSTIAILTVLTAGLGAVAYIKLRKYREI